MQEPGKPRLVSMLVYLNSMWPLENGAETSFLDATTDTGILVRPKPGRVILMDQDIMHKVNAPTGKAGRPRYSLVWKLAVLPKCENGSGRTSVPHIAKHNESVPIVSFGSAARMKVAQQQLQ